eukprot:2398442-Alexandrium_andersonii.AAC.1
MPPWRMWSASIWHLPNGSVGRRALPDAPPAAGACATPYQRATAWARGPRSSGCRCPTSADHQAIGVGA